MNINSISDFRQAMRNGPFAWPGSYPLYFITSDGEAMSFASAKYNRRKIIEAIHDKDDSGWRVIAIDINWEDADLHCVHSGERIESAYAEKDALLA